MKRLILFLMVLAFAQNASAEAAFQFAAPGLRAPDDPNVNGVRFVLLYGAADSVRGLDFGLISMNETGTLSGLALVAGVSKVTTEMDGGAAISAVNIHNGNDRGLNMALVNRLNEASQAVNIGFLNIADGSTMVDVGGLNISDQSTVQLGFLNVTKEIKGVQIGFLNIAENGFLPVFPFFNFPRN